MTTSDRRIACIVAAASAILIGCSTGGGAVDGHAGGARVGAEPIPRVHLFENHSSALIAWAQGHVRDRILVHLDGHSDLDWLPDETVARIAAADAPDLRFLEHHPYAMDADAMEKFGIWNFVYPASRLGLVRSLVWVVPDGTLVDGDSGWRLAWEMLAQKLEHVGLAEATGLRVDGRVVRGEVLGLPVIVCELADLPAIDEPVLLDIDLDYFTTASAISLHVTERPQVHPDDVIAALGERGLRTDIATLSLSTIGGYLPPENRWLGAYLSERLRDPRGVEAGLADMHVTASDAMASGRTDDAVAALREAIDRAPDDACAWHCLSHALEAVERPVEAEQARLRAITLDPLLGHESLFHGDRHWLNGSWSDALDDYRSYLRELPVGPFTAYAVRREAGSLMRLRRDDEAIAVYERVLTMAPEHADSLLDLGLLYRDRGDLGSALGMLRRAREAVPERSTYAAALGSSLLLSGRVDEGIAHLEDAVRAKPTAVRARLNLAAALAETGRGRESAGHVRVVLSIDPENPRARGIARALAARGVGLTDP